MRKVAIIGMIERISGEDILHMASLNGLRSRIEDRLAEIRAGVPVTMYAGKTKKGG
jgi:hypothetical protein